MRLFAAGFLLGTSLLQLESRLPEFPFLALGMAVLLAAALVRPGAARCLVVALAGALLGYGHAAWRAEARLADALAFAREGEDIAITGVVASLPQVNERGTRFLFHVEEGAGVPRGVSLTWYAERSADPAETPRIAPVKAGERWTLTARFKRPRGLANPHGFDFEAWALERGIRATGYVRTGAAPVRVTAQVHGWPYSLHRWRGDIRERMERQLGDARLRGVLVALAIGDQDAVAPEDWDVFWRTGVGHLMSISGLHITMLAALAFAIAAFAWVRVPALALRFPARKAAAVAGIAAALAYTLATGYAVPAQRTFLMLAVVAGCLLANRHGSASRVLALAALAVLLVDPWAVLAGGFWLSFGAVAAIFHVMAGRTGRMGTLGTAGLEQLAVTVAMVPMLMALFQEMSLVSPLANALAIPLVSLVIVPLALAGGFLPWAWPLEAGHALLEWLMVPLEALASWSGAVLESHAPAAWTVAAAAIGCAWLLGPRGLPMRSCGAVWIAPLFLMQPPQPAPGAAWLDVLDVGHGLAMVVRTTHHTLVYDAGPSWSRASDSGERIVAPHLRGEGLRTLDGLVVSHADDDHAGGAASVAMRREPGWLLSSLPAEHPLHLLFTRSMRCVAGQRWRWDGVDFEVMHPTDAIYDTTRKVKENDRSCVLRIATAGATVLLPADLEARGEAELVRRAGTRLAAEVLLVPHHGSRTSSTEPFLDLVRPGIAVVSLGHRNRFRHPHPVVAARYAARGVEWHRTDRAGALRIVLPAESGARASVQPLARPVRYWSDRGKTP